LALNFSNNYWLNITWILIQKWWLKSCSCLFSQVSNKHKVFLAQAVELVPNSWESSKISQGQVVGCHFGNVLVSGTLLVHLDYKLKFFLGFFIGRLCWWLCICVLGESTLRWSKIVVTIFFFKLHVFELLPS
jgi:hypothetical protein